MKKTFVMEGVLFGIAKAVLGILLLINPIGFSSNIIKLAGVALLIVGVISLIGYFRTDPEEAHVGQGLMIALCAMIGGGFCLLHTEWFIATFPLLI